MRVVKRFSILKNRFTFGRDRTLKLNGLRLGKCAAGLKLGNREWIQRVFWGGGILIKMALYCHRCGTALPVSARFCSNCGTTVFVAPQAGRPLVRPIVGRQIAGVCLGLSQANGWDVAVVRIISVLAFFFSGGVVAVAYLAGWIGIPEETVPFPGPMQSGPPVPPVQPGAPGSPNY